MSDTVDEYFKIKAVIRQLIFNHQERIKNMVGVENDPTVMLKQEVGSLQSFYNAIKKYVEEN